MSTAERIRALRKEKGLTQDEVAKKCGMAASAIRKYESGRVVPKFETIQRIATALNVDFIDLIEFEIEPKTEANEKALKDMLSTFERFKKEGKKIVWQNGGIYAIKKIPAEKLQDALEKLNKEGIEKLADYAADLASLEKYTT